MSALSAAWGQWTRRFAAMTRRERAIVAGALILGGGLMIYNLAIDPHLTKMRNATRALTAAQAELGQQQLLATTLKAQYMDPDAGNRDRLAKAKQELAAINERLAGMEAGMVPPERMRGFLESLLARNRNIELLGLKTLPAALIGAQVVLPKTDGVQTRDAESKDKVAESAAPDGIYQHGIEIRLAGSYNDLLAYIEELERMPQRVMWKSVSLTVDKYPRNVLVLRVFTLSLDKNWLVV